MNTLLPVEALEMEILAASGELQAAYEGIVRIVEVAGRVYLKEGQEFDYHSNYYVLLALEARILLGLGEYSKAKSMLDKVIPKQVELHGEEENKVLESRVARAHIDLIEDRPDDAKKELLHIASLLKRRHFQTHYLIRRIDDILASASVEQPATGHRQSADME